MANDKAPAIHLGGSLERGGQHHGIDAAGNGDLILVDAGRYDAIVIDKSISVVGTGFGGPAVVCGDGAEAAVTVKGARVRVSSLKIVYHANGLGGHALTTVADSWSNVLEHAHTKK